MNRKVISFINKVGENVLDVISREYPDLVGTEIVNENQVPDIETRNDLSQKLGIIAQEKGLGVATSILHEQGIKSGWLKESPEYIISGDQSIFTKIDVRKIRANIPMLREAGIFTTPDERFPIVKHQNGQTCFFCSSARLTPKQVLLDYKVSSGNTYQGGFTFAPFGNPKNVFHHVMWKKHNEGVVDDMSFSQNTVSDLIDMVVSNSNAVNMYAVINGTRGFKVDGFFNGWAGNSIYHQHFQFASFEDIPIRNAEVKETITVQDDFKIDKLDWPTTVYRIEADNIDKLKEVATEIGMLWKHQIDDGVPTEIKYMDSDIMVDNHTQNIYVPGDENGKVLYFIPRYRSRGDAEKVLPEGQAIFKNNLAVIEMIGRFIIDDEKSFEIINNLTPEERDKVMNKWLSDVNPSEGIEKLEDTIANRYPFNHVDYYQDKAINGSRAIAK